jgi:hypothetical protein
MLNGQQPIVGASLNLYEAVPRKDGPPGRLMSVNPYWVKTDDRGRFEFPFVETNRKFTLFVHAEGYNYATSGRTVLVAAGQTVEIDFSLKRLDKSVAGIVIDPDGKPVAGAQVSAQTRSGQVIPGASLHRPTGEDGRFTIRGVPDEPLTLMAYIRPPPDSGDRPIRLPTSVDAEPGQTDVRILLDPKLAGRRRTDAAPAAVPTPAQILERLRARRDSVENLVVEASWEEYQNDKPSAWEDGAIYRDKQGRIRIRYHHGPGALESADKNNAKLVDETYNGKFTVNTSEDPTLDRLGNPLKPDAIADPTNRYRSVMIYNHKFPSPEWSAAESHRNPFKCMDEPVIRELSVLLAASKTVAVKPVNGQQGVYELGYELDPKNDPDHLTHRVQVDAGKGWVVTRHEQFFPDGKSARLSTCDYRRGEDGWWVPTAGQFRHLWGKEVPNLDWRFKAGRVVVNDPHFDQSIFQPEMEAFPLRELTESVAGIVIDPEGNPVEGVSVRADLHSGQALLMAFAGQTTGKDGRFSIDGLPNAPIPITAFIEPPSDSKDHRMRFPAEVKAKPGQKDLRIVLDPKLTRGKK